MLSEARIAISGKSGCGNSTATRLVARELGLRIINYTFHNMAEEMGITFEEMVELANGNPPGYDIELDQKLVEMSAAPGCVLGSRLAIWLLKDADLKVYLEVPADVRARRIARREGSPFREAYEAMMRRDRLDHDRYLSIYDIDTDCYEFSDIVIDADRLDQHGVARAIVEELRRRKRCR